MTSDGKHWFWANCGKCLNCKKMKINELTLRLKHEMRCHENSVFITLTYSDDFLPISQKNFGQPLVDRDILRGSYNFGNPTLFKRDLQLFFKRLRKQFCDRKLRYFYCGEYGGQTGRPHYHAVVFGISEFEMNLRNKWEYGFISVSKCTVGRCRYTAKYLLKSEIYTPNFCYSHGIQPQFHQASNRPGLGYFYLEKNVDKLLENLSVTNNGKHVPLPRYYFKKLKEIDETLPERIALKNDAVISEQISLNPSFLEKYQRKHDLERLRQLELNKISEIKLKGL